jgi:hypothetical protein
MGPARRDLLRSREIDVLCACEIAALSERFRMRILVALGGYFQAPAALLWLLDNRYADVLPMSPSFQDD